MSCHSLWLKLCSFESKNKWVMFLDT
jgi:hypothetical protein